MASAATLARSVLVHVDEQVLLDPAATGQGHHDDLGDEDRFPGAALGGPVECGDIPESGQDQHGIGRPGQAGEGSSQRRGDLGAQAPGRADQAEHDDLATHPDRSSQDMEGETERVEARCQHGE